jgi:endonuclease YncB( thermonuclease family)
VLLFLILVLAAILPARAETLHGPVQAEVVRIVDGDTFVADALVWPGQRIRVSVRIRGIDAPELKARCAPERANAEQARDALTQMLGSGTVFMREIGADKYYGRVTADVTTAAGFDVASALLRHAHARAYDGGARLAAC